MVFSFCLNFIYVAYLIVFVYALLCVGEHTIYTHLESRTWFLVSFFIALHLVFETVSQRTRNAQLARWAHQ